jgi:hypothetical protein
MKTPFKCSRVVTCEQTDTAKLVGALCNLSMRMRQKLIKTHNKVIMSDLPTPHSRQTFSRTACCVGWLQHIGLENRGQRSATHNSWYWEASCRSTSHEFHSLLRNPEVHYHVHKSLPLETVIYICSALKTIPYNVVTVLFRNFVLTTKTDFMKVPSEYDTKIIHVRGSPRK